MELLPHSGSKQYGLSAAIVRNTNIHLGTDKLGGMTSRIRGQAPKRHLKWRRLMTNFLLLWRGISLGSDAVWKLKRRSVTQLSVVFLLVVQKIYTLWSDLLL